MCRVCLRYGGGTSRPYNQRRYQHAPAHTPPTVVTPPRRSLFKDAAAVAGGVTVGTTVGHVAGEAITGLFGGRRRQESEYDTPPPNYEQSSAMYGQQNYQELQNGPCAYELSQFLNCTTNTSNLQDCAAFNEALLECKRRNRGSRSPPRYAPQKGYHGGRPHTPPMAAAPSRGGSMFKDAAAVAGGVAVGTTVGHVAGQAITGMFGGGQRQQEVERALPANYNYEQEPSGPCAYEISQFLNCAANRQDLQECAEFNEALKECKRRNRKLRFNRK